MIYQNTNNRCSVWITSNLKKTFQNWKQKVYTILYYDVTTHEKRKIHKF